MLARARDCSAGILSSRPLTYHTRQLFAYLVRHARDCSALPKVPHRICQTSSHQTLTVRSCPDSRPASTCSYTPGCACNGPQLSRCQTPSVHHTLHQFVSRFTSSSALGIAVQSEFDTATMVTFRQCDKARSQPCCRIYCSTLEIAVQQPNKEAF
jgi:hypothetical protein